MTTDPPRDVRELIDSDDDLSEPELARLAEYAETAWSDVLTRLRVRANSTYGVADPDDFAECVNQHMGIPDRVEMMSADTYWCPDCGRHLKDRRTPVASGVIGERMRIRALYQAIADAPDEPARTEALRRFIAALGLTPPAEAL